MSGLHDRHKQRTLRVDTALLKDDLRWPDVDLVRHASDAPRDLFRHARQVHEKVDLPTKSSLVAFRKALAVVATKHDDQSGVGLGGLDRCRARLIRRHDGRFAECAAGADAGSTCLLDNFSRGTFVLVLAPPVRTASVMMVVVMMVRMMMLVRVLVLVLVVTPVVMRFSLAAAAISLL